MERILLVHLGVPSKLEHAFVEDHRKLTQGFSRLISLVEDERYGQARLEAQELDTMAGPHIEFEEKSFYPEVEKTRGRGYVQTLYAEHRAGLEAIRLLSALSPEGTLSPADRERVLSLLRQTLQHTVSCGTLLSHVTCLEEARQQDFLSELLRYREHGHRWTELHPERAVHDE